MVNTLGTYYDEEILGTDLNSAGFQVTTGSGKSIVDLDDPAYVPAIADVPVPTPKPDVNISYGQHEGQDITGTKQTPAGFQITLANGQKKIVDPSTVNKTRTISEETSEVPAVPEGEGTPPEMITLQTPEGVSFEVTQDQANSGVVKGPGGRSYTIAEKDGVWSASIAGLPEAGDKNITSVANTMKDFFGIDNKFLGRALLYYLGGRATGGSHAGSLQWAGKQAIKELNAREKAAGKSGVKKTKNSTMVHVSSDGTRTALPSRTTTYMNGKETTQVYHNKKWTDIADVPGVWDEYRTQDTGAADVERWNNIRDFNVKYIEKQFTGDFETVGKQRGSRWADQIILH